MQTQSDRMRAAHQRLTKAVESIVTGDDWARMLKVAAKFHHYSLNNQLMIFLQRPDATRVAGFRRWQELGRRVRKGEKGIAIFAPCRYRVPTESDQTSAPERSSRSAAASRSGKSEPEDVRPTAEVVRGFRIVYVFDISQTEGEPLEDDNAVRPELLDGDAPEGIWEALVAQANAAGFEVVRERKRSENGYCDFLDKRISVRPDVAPAQAVKTLVHELGHALLHRKDSPKSREIAEVEVESVAFVVLEALGMSSDSYSFPYVARWSQGNVDLLKQSAERSISCARQILACLSDPAVEVVSPSA